MLERPNRAHSQLDSPRRKNCRNRSLVPHYESFRTTLALATIGLGLGDSLVRMIKLASRGSVIALKDLGHRRGCWAISKNELDFIQTPGKVGGLGDSEGRAAREGGHMI